MKTLNWLDRIAKLTSAILILGFGCSSTREPIQAAADSKNRVSLGKLFTWDFYGLGEATVEDVSTLRLSEYENSKGFMIISPDSYSTDVVLSYRIKALNADSVLVAILSLSDPGQTDHLTVPDPYDGSIQWLLTDAGNYFFAFHNAAHNATPFIRRHPGGGTDGEKLADLGRNVLEPGVWYHVEAGRKRGRIWLILHGKATLETEDPDPLSGGRIALRIRGTADTPAECLIRDVFIRSDTN